MPVNITEEFVRQLMAQIDFLTKQNSTLTATIAELNQTIPKNIKATVQYGKNLQAMVVAFNTVGAVSINRTHEILFSVFNIPLATGTIKNMVTRCAEPLISFSTNGVLNSYEK